MLWMMTRGHKAQPEADDAAAKQAELAGLQARIDQLKAASATAIVAALSAARGYEAVAAAGRGGGRRAGPYLPDVPATERRGHCPAAGVHAHAVTHRQGHGGNDGLNGALQGHAPNSPAWKPRSYLEVLVRKPGALPGATALVQARESGVFTAAHEAFWAGARKAHGDFGGTQAMIEVLLHRHLPHPDIVTALGLVVAVGGTTADVVAVEARKLARLRPELEVAAEAPADPRRGVSLTERRLLDPAAVIAGLPADTRPLPSVAAYDELLPRRAAAITTEASTQGAVS